MASSSVATLKPGWEAVTAEDGRIYYWNADTDDTTWEMPVAATDMTSPAPPGMAKKRSTPTAQSIADLMEGEPTRVAADMLFKYFDRDGNKLLDAQETARMLNEYGFTSEQTLLLRELMDGDGDGMLTFDEKRNKLELVRDDTRFHLLKEAGQFFRAADADGDGTVSRAELAKAFRSEWGKTQAEAEAIVQQIDTDGNELISLNEYLSFLAGYPEWQALRLT